MIKIEGLDKLQRDIGQAQKAMEAVEDGLGTVKFDPEDPASIEAAIQDMEKLVDDRLGSYASNPIVGPMIKGAKESFRQAILDKAAAARFEGGHSHDEQ
jgi:hypothetical protein